MNKRTSMRIPYVILLLTPAALLASASAQVRTPGAIMESVEFRQDFEEGHVSGWESYPPFQDSAFDPDFKCSSENNMPGSHYALTRKVQLAFPTEYEIGFIRKIHLYATKSSTVSFSFLLNMYGDAEKMEAVLCGLNGKKYTHAFQFSHSNEWQNVTVPVASFTDGRETLSAGQGVEAFYVLAYVGKTNPDVAYRFYLDNVVITGAAPVQFQVRVPKSTVLDHWNKTVLAKHYHTGEKLGLSVALPSAVRLTSVKFSLRGPDRRNVLDGVSLPTGREANVWEDSALYAFSAKDPKGIWKAKLTGENGQGGYVETLFDIWVTDGVQPHPRLYFGGDNIDFYRRRMEEPKWKLWCDSIAARSLQLRTTSNLGSIVPDTETSSHGSMTPEQWTLESMKHVDLSIYDTTYLLPTLPHYYAVMYPAAEILYDHALLYALRGEPAIAQYAKDALLVITGWKTWTHPWFRARHQESYYPVGELGVRAAFCYDVVYPLLTPEERKSVQDGFLRNCIIPVYQEYVVEDRIPSSTSNWIANSVSGALSCLLAIYGDDSDLGDLEPYLSGLLTKLQEHVRSTLDTSGAWGEGLGYQSFAYTNMLPTITALDRVLHTDIAPPALLHSYLYFLYNNFGSEILDVGDSHPNLGTLSSFAWILSRTDDPIFRWLYRSSPKEQVVDFLFGRDRGVAQRPDSLPASKLFSDIGGATFRSGWSPNDVVMNFRCGPFFNHQHFHQGSFQLAAFGETLVPEAGVVNYYNDPWYQPYYIQAVGHNTILVDGNPGSQRSGDYLHFVKAADSRAEMKEFVGTAYYGAATGELHTLYRGILKLFERNIVFMPPDFFVVFDQLRSNGAEHEYDWLLHFDDAKDATVSGSDITVKRGHASLLAKVLFPRDAVIQKREAPVRLGTPITHPGYLQIANEQKRKDEDFLVVLYPARNAPSAQGGGNAGIPTLSDAIGPLKGKNYVGMRIRRGGGEDQILFRIDDKKENINDGHIQTDGRLVARSVRGGKLEMLAVHDGTYLTCDFPGWLKGLTGSTRITAAGTLDARSATWEIQARDAGTLTFRCERKPLVVKSLGKTISSYSWDEGKHLLEIAVSEGGNTFAFSY
jgi:hypothetical protein